MHQMVQILLQHWICLELENHQYNSGKCDERCVGGRDKLFVILMINAHSGQAIAVPDAKAASSGSRFQWLSSHITHRYWFQFLW